MESILFSFKMEHQNETDPKRNLIELPKVSLCKEFNCEWPFWISFAIIIAGFVLLAG